MIDPLPAEDHRCTGCGLAYDRVTISDALGMIEALPRQLSMIIDPLAAEVLHRRPAAGGWSITEYLCHLRDVHISYTIRLHRTRTESEPVLEPMLNDLRARRFGYNDRDPVPVLAELPAVAAGFGDEVRATTATELERTATRLPGERRTARWLIRQAMHEGVHHTADIQRLADALG